MKKTLIEFTINKKFLTIDLEDFNHIEQYNEDKYTSIVFNNGTNRYVDGSYAEVSKRLESLGVEIIRIEDKITDFENFKNKENKI